jgi:hypothetical protein
MAYDYRLWQKFKDIMNRGPKIRPATICDLNGKIVYSEQREGVKNLLDPEGVKNHLSWQLIRGKHAELLQVVVLIGEKKGDSLHSVKSQK